MERYKVVKGLDVCVDTDAPCQQERGHIRLPAAINDWQQVLEDVWESLLTNEDKTVVITSKLEDALLFSNLFLQSLGYTSQRASLELQSIFGLSDPPPCENITEQYSLPNAVGYQFMRFKKVVETLREKCPWDREVTPYQLVTLSREELSELMEAITNEDTDNYAEELGDLWLHLLLHSVIAEENAAFKLVDVFKKASEKAILRHPHVFASDHDSDAATVLSKWQERKGKRDPEETVPPDVFVWALRLQDEAHHHGLDWENPMELRGKLEEEFEELCSAYESKEPDKLKEEVGDLLFTVVNLARLLNVDPEDALLHSSRKFQRRLKYVAEHEGESEVETLWEESKNEVG